MARPTRIYTRTGDDGSTGLVGGRRVSKDDPRIWAYGTVDELNAALGLVRSALADNLAAHHAEQIDAFLAATQNELFDLGAELATPTETASPDIQRITTDQIKRVETMMDELDGELGALKEFILPGGISAAALLHQARTICRRAERYCVRLSTAEPVGECAAPYLNRLSDALFVLARWVNRQAGVTETTWRKDRQ
jgi:cob(I)alamin adenosyltransferase